MRSVRILALCSLAFVSCYIPEVLEPLLPGQDQLSLVGPVPVAVAIPRDADVSTLDVRLDGVSVRAQLPAATAGLPLYGTVQVATPGLHLVQYSVLTTEGELQTASRTFETVVLESPTACDVLNNAECLLPYPSSRFEVPDASTPTGVRLSIPASGLPTLIGPALSPAPYNALDGFSPTPQIAMHFPGGVNLALSGAAILRGNGAAQSPPFVGIRMADARSLESDSPTVLIDAETGERVLHWAELDARADGNAARQALFLRAGTALRPGGHYVVAVRRLRHPSGATIQPEPAFDALRDARPSDIPGFQERREYYEANVFPVLAAAGVARADLQLAFDFHVQSESQLTRQMLAMRDRAFAWIDAETANPATQLFTIPPGGTQTFNCATPGVRIWRRIAGTIQSPLFLTAPPTGAGAPQHLVDAGDLPVQNGTMNADFTISIPCSALDPEEPVLHPLVLGHGLFGRGTDMVDGVPNQITAALANPASGVTGTWRYVAGATDFRGLSNQDLSWVAFNVIGLGANELNSFPAFPDRLRQGALNTLVLARLMKSGHFNRHPDFVTPGGREVFPGPSEEAYYYGISLGGIMGTHFAAFSPDVTAVHIDVPAINFNLLVQRSTQFTTFETLFTLIGLTDPMDTAIGLGLLHELWVSAEPASVARHVTGLVDPPLPGTNAKKVLMSVAWLDKQVSNQASELEARTLGIGNLAGSLLQGYEGIDDVAGPQDSAMVVWSTGAFDLWDPAQQTHIPPLANRIPSSACDPHGGRPTIPAGVQMALDFLQPGGTISNTCSGFCDAGIPFEQPAAGICVLPP
jgi:hypothetical protein